MFIFNERLQQIDTKVIDNQKQIIFSTIDKKEIINWLKSNYFPESFIEDIQSEDQSITYEETESFKFLVLKYIKFDEEEALLYDDSNVVFIVIKNKLFILSENRDVIVELVKKFSKRHHKYNYFEYIIYQVADILVDNTIIIVDVIDEALENLEDSIFHENIEEDELQKDIYYSRRTLNRITKVSIHEKDVLNRMYNRFSNETKKELKFEFIDLNEHLKYLINESKTLLDRTGYLLNLHMGILSTRMNKAMQRLAAISLIFLTCAMGHPKINF